MNSGTDYLLSDDEPIEGHRHQMIELDKDDPHAAEKLLAMERAASAKGKLSFSGGNIVGTHLQLDGLLKIAAEMTDGFLEVRDVKDISDTPPSLLYLSNDSEGKFLTPSHEPGSGLSKETYYGEIIPYLVRETKAIRIVHVFEAWVAIHDLTKGEEPDMKTPVSERSDRIEAQITFGYDAPTNRLVFMVKKIDRTGETVKFIKMPQSQDADCSGAEQLGIMQAAVYACRENALQMGLL